MLLNSTGSRSCVISISTKQQTLKTLSLQIVLELDMDLAKTIIEFLHGRNNDITIHV